jgi:hypothetical protein
VLVGLASETVGGTNVDVDDDSIDDGGDGVSEEGDEESSNATSEDDARDEMEVWANEMQEGGDLVTPVAELAAFDENVSISNNQCIATAMNDDVYATVWSSTPMPPSTATTAAVIDTSSESADPSPSPALGPPAAAGVTNELPKSGRARRTKRVHYYEPCPGPDCGQKIEGAEREDKSTVAACTGSGCDTIWVSSRSDNSFRLTWTCLNSTTYVVLMQMRNGGRRNGFVNRV